MIKKFFLEKKGKLYIDGYKLISFNCNEESYHEYPISWRIKENMNFMIKNDIDFIYYEINIINKSNSYHIQSFINEKISFDHRCIQEQGRKVSELILMINNNEKINILINFLLKEGLQSSYQKIKSILKILSHYRYIMNKLVFAYLNVICNLYEFHKKNNIKYYEFLLLSHLPPEKIIF